jgi:hypothetical protein
MTNCTSLKLREVSQTVTQTVVPRPILVVPRYCRSSYDILTLQSSITEKATREEHHCGDTLPDHGKHSCLCGKETRSRVVMSSKYRTWFYRR